MSDKYDDIINLPHYQSVKRKHMSMHDRAAQFAPFAALTGYGDAVDETARLTDSQLNLDDDYILSLNEELCYIKEHVMENPMIKITYFMPDEKKAGGKYITVSDRVKKLDAVSSELILCSGPAVPIESIYEIYTDKKS